MDTITIIDESGEVITFDIVDETPPQPTVIVPPQYPEINDDYGPYQAGSVEDLGWATA